MGKRKRDQDGPTQETPKGHMIPVPTREQVFRDPEKAAKPPSKSVVMMGFIRSDDGRWGR
jgi:hypothetical protein